jgi:hypothetical protein
MGFAMPTGFQFSAFKSLQSSKELEMLTSREVRPQHCRKPSSFMIHVRETLFGIFEYHRNWKIKCSMD